MNKWISKIAEFIGKWGGKGQEDASTETSKAVSIGTEKLAEYCLHCNSRKFVKKGKRKKKLEVVQLYKCRSCGNRLQWSSL